MYQEILYEIVIFDHILGEGGWYMNIYGRRLFALGAVFRSSVLCLFYINMTRWLPAPMAAELSVPLESKHLKYVNTYSFQS